jgi:hypothetical protein
MPLPDLTEEEQAELVDLLRATINTDRFPFSPRIRKLRSILEFVQASPSARGFPVKINSDATYVGDNGSNMIHPCRPPAGRPCWENAQLAGPSPLSGRRRTFPGHGGGRY